MARRKNGSPRAQPNPTFDLDFLRQIIEVLETTDVTRVSWSKGEERIQICRDAASSLAPAASVRSPVAVTAAPPAAAPAPSAKAKEGGHLVTSPFVGTFYRSPSPDQPAFVEVGSTVKKGQIICIVEAMKLMNEIESEVAGKVAEILVQNGEPVEFGQALFRVEAG